MEWNEKIKDEFPFVEKSTLDSKKGSTLLCSNTISCLLQKSNMFALIRILHPNFPLNSRNLEIPSVGLQNYNAV